MNLPDQGDPALPLFRVVTAITAYETYTVRAADSDEAERLIMNDDTRAALLEEVPTASAPNGYGDDTIIVETRRL